MESRHIVAPKNKRAPIDRRFRLGGKDPYLSGPILGVGALVVCSGGACLPRSGAEGPRSAAPISPCRRSGMILLLQAPEARHRISPARESLCRNWGSDLQVRHN